MFIRAQKSCRMSEIVRVAPQFLGDLLYFWGVLLCFGGVLGCFWGVLLHFWGDLWCFWGDLRCFFGGSGQIGSETGHFSKFALP